MDLGYEIVISFIVLNILYGIIRLYFVNGIWDKVISLNIVSIDIFLLMILHASKLNRIDLLDMAFAYSVLGFLCLALIATFILSNEKRDKFGNHN